MLTITLPPDVESRLREQAVSRGIDAADYASKLILEHLPSENGDEGGDDDFRLRGTVPIELDREQIFTKSVNVTPEQLPRWEPQITLTRRAEDEDE